MTAYTAQQTRRGSQAGCRSFAMSAGMGRALACPVFFALFVIILARLLGGLFPCR